MKPLTATVLIGLLAATPSLGQVATRNLAAPPDDILSGVLRRPDPLTLGTSSSAAAVPFDLALQPDGTWRAIVPLPVGDPATARLLVASPDADGWTTTLQLGKAAPVRLTADLRDAGITGHRGPLGVPGTETDATLYTITTTEPEWTLEVIGNEPARHAADGIPDGIVLLTSDHPATLYACVDGPARVGEPITLFATLYDRTRTVHRPGDAPPAGLDARVTGTRLMVDDMPMHRDSLTWGNQEATGIDTLVFDTPGIHRVTLDVEATVNRRVIRRTVSLLVPVTAYEADLDAALAGVADDELTITLALSDTRLPDHLRMGAELWGQRDGEPVPVCWLGGMVVPSATSGDATLDLALHADWVAHAGAAAPFTLRHLRLEDPDHHVAFAGVDEIAIDVPREIVDRPAPPAVTPAMLTGRLDPRRTVAVPAGIAPRDFGAHNLMLVHGYCAGGNPFPTSHFSGALEIFGDPNQTRSQDEFALLIASLGSQSKSYGVVAHSQGGLATLHLYTYYWSGLDWARGPRLIQSLGSPYQGTALAGNLAGLGEVFGTGCGENYDMTYDGAAAWLSGIPTWARQRVNYHTTSFNDPPFSYDYCNFATDFFLTDPEDGVVEQWAGQLPGAVNRGHVTGWCHTTGMRDPAQYTDASRNATMNQEAAR